MKRVLMMYGEPFVYGGQETFSINLYKNIIKINKNIKIDFYTPFKVLNKTLISMLKNDKFFYDNKSFNKVLRKINFTHSFKKFIKKHKNDYDIVHINSGSSYILSKGAKIAKKAGIKQVIVHSHASGVSSLKHKIINKIFEKNFKYADDYLACSDDAATFRFPKCILEKKMYRVVPNGIDLDKYKLDEQIRKKYRKELNINENDILLGNVGRLSNEKNQLFILEILKKLLQEDINYKLLLIGDGILKEKLKNYIQKYNLNSNVIMLEKRSDICNLLMAMDVFVFPSIYEGLGIALIEAEATGMPCICSKGIPKQAVINDNCIIIEDYNEQKWIDEIKSVNLEKKVNYNKMKYYSIENTVQEIVEIYSNREDRN